LGEKPKKKPVKKLTEQQIKCLDCRECCEYVELPVTMISIEILEYFIMRGQKFYIDDTGVLMVRLHDPCKHLSQDGRCKDYDKRPYTCREYMCDEKDSRIKKSKADACQQCLVDVAATIEKYRKEQKEKGGSINA